MEGPPWTEDGNDLPPIPPDLPIPDTSNASTVRRVAAFSLVAPLMALGLSLVANMFLTRQTEPALQSGLLLIGAICGLMLLAGLILAITALSLMKQHGRQGIFGPALSGLIMNSLLIVIGLIAIPALSRTREHNQHRAQSAAEVNEVVSGIREDAAKDMQGKKGAELVDKKLADLQHLDLGLTNLSSENASLVLKATAAYFKRMQDVFRAHDKNVHLLVTEKVLDMSAVHHAEDLQAKRVLLRAFLKSNEEFKSFFENADNIMEEELRKEKVPPKLMAACMKSFRSHQEGMKGPIKLRDLDRQIGESMLAAIDLLDQNFGKWKFVPEKRQIQFNNTELAGRYNVIIKQIHSVGTEQKQLQEQLIGRMQ